MELRHERAVVGPVVAGQEAPDDGGRWAVRRIIAWRCGEPPAAGGREAEAGEGEGRTTMELDRDRARGANA